MKTLEHVVVKTIEEEYNVKQTRSVKLKYGASRIIIPA